MPDKHVFVDTNVLVYAHDLDAGKKHELAEDKVKELWDRELSPSISIQVLQEFYVNLIRKGIAPETARETTTNYLQWDVIDNDRFLLQEGMRLKERWKVSFWDALILAAAARSKAAVVWSEDLNPEQNYDGIRVVNPLAV